MNTSQQYTNRGKSNVLNRFKRILCDAMFLSNQREQKPAKTLHERTMSYICLTLVQNSPQYPNPLHSLHSHGNK